MVILRGKYRFWLIVSCICLSCSPPILPPLLAPGTERFSLDYHVQPVSGKAETVRVTLTLPQNAPPCDSFCFALQVPGSYERRPYATFVSGIVFITSAGDTVIPKMIDSAIYTVNEPLALSRIVYDVASTHTRPHDSLPEFAGTRFDDSYWQINTYAVFGFIPRLMDQPIRIVLDIPGEWRIGSALPADTLGHLFASSTFELFDSPILAGNLSRSAFVENNRPVFVHTISSGRAIRSTFFKNTLKKSVREADAFIPSASRDPYTFLLNVLPEKPFSVGAHEHRRSSICSLYVKNPGSTKHLLGIMARHELFHRTIPLSLESREIRNNQYLGIHPVSHLWFYEGLAQWATFKMQLMNGTMSVKKFCTVLRNELYIGDTKKDSLGLIAVSESVLDRHRSLEQFYRRGFLFCTMLDIFIIEKTKGHKTLRDVVLALNAAYPHGRPFDADSLFGMIASMTNPGVLEFCENHLRKNEPLPMQSLFNTIGIRYVPMQSHPRMLADFGVLAYKDLTTRRMVVTGVFNDAPECGFKPGDTLLTIDGEDFYLDASCARAIGRLFFSSVGTAYSAVVMRNGKEWTIRGRTVPYYNRHVFFVDNTASQESRVLRKIWTSR